MKRLWGAVLLNALSGVLLAHADSAHLVLSGHVRGVSGTHAVYVALWQKGEFLERPASQVRIAPGAAAEFRFNVSPGDWALSAFEDNNDNGVLDMGLFGPKEPSGFWRPFTAWRKPRFEDVSSIVTRDTPNADIRLK